MSFGPKAPHYRPEIDGLRALAVVPVILFHAGAPGFDGGFVGVDIFFVISGFLITSIILTERARGRFSLRGFYLRRVRRLLPALFTVMIVCLPFAWFWMTPPKLEFFGRSVVAVLLFVSNVLFWRESGYFADAAEENVLLHTWSLAVEEQYYLLFPLLMVVCWRLGQRWLLGLLLLGAALSLGASEWAWRYQPAANFYLAPTRAFELLIGASGAVWLQHRPVRGNSGLSAVGLAMLVFSVVWLEKSDPFPSVLALVPVTGTLLILLAGNRETVTGRLLSSRALVGIGLISYSAYLWHQPVFAFARIRLGEDATLPLLLVLVVPILGLAWMSWRFVEVPCRNADRVAVPRLLTGLGISGILLAAFGAGAAMTTGFPDRFNLPPTVADSFAKTPRATECFGEIGAHIIPDWGCRLGETAEPASWMVFGDSHALAMLPAMETVARNLDRPAFFAGANGCLPLLLIHSIRSDQHQTNCHALNRRVLDHARATGMKLVVLVARWTYYTDGGYDGSQFSHVTLEPGSAKDKEHSRAAFLAGLGATVDAYAQAGIGLIIVSQVPQQREDPRSIYYSAYEDDHVGAALWHDSVSRSDHDRLQRFVEEAFREAIAPLRHIDLAGVLCGPRCRIGTEQASWYSDDDHLSLEGAAKVVPVLQDRIGAALLRRGD